MRMPSRPSRVAAALLLSLGLSVAPAVGQGSGASPPAPSERPVPSFGGIFTETLHDFTRLPTRTNIVWLAAGGVTAGALVPVDREASDAMAGSSGARTFFASGDVMGNALIPIGTGFAVYGIGRLQGHARAALVGSDLIRAQLVSGGLTLAVKHAVRRKRPDGTARVSFPSGHTSSIFATAGIVLHHFGWRWGVPAYAGAVYVGLSRVQTRRHYPSDVAFGAAIGIVSARTVTLGAGRRKTTVAPMIGPGVAGLAVRVGR